MIAPTAGRMNRRVHLQRETRVRDDAGGYEVDQTWETVATVWASYRPIRGGEFFAAEAAQSEVTHRCVIRAQVQVNNLMRVVVLPTGRVAHVVSAHEVGDGSYLELMVQEVPAPDDARVTREG